MLEGPRKPKILVVDDVSQNVRLLELSLKAGGYRAISAFSGREALEKVETEQPDLLLLDVMMPGMDGYEVCKRISVSERVKETKIIIMTGYEISNIKEKSCH